MPPENLNVYLTRGLQGKDDHIDLLSDLFEQCQTVTVETADPMLDLISFAQDCAGFWVVNISNGTIPPDEALLSERPSEEYTNPSGLLPSNPEGAHSQLIEPFPLDAERQERFSDYLDTALVSMPSTSNSNAGAQYNPSPPTQRQSPALYSKNDRDQLNTSKNIAGFIYLVPSSAYPDALHFREYNIGIILSSEWRSQSVAQRALHLALDQVFSGPNVHRVQAQLIDCYKNDKALALFTRMGFSHEGTRRQGFHCPLTAEWKDVTTLALLVTDWVVHVRDRTHGFRSAPKSLWDALFARHQREREELLRWEDRRPHRSSSLETIRDSAATPIPGIPGLGESDASDSEAGFSSENDISVLERPKRKLFEIGDGTAENASDAYDASSSEYDCEYESAVEGSPPKRFRGRQKDPSSAITSAGALGIDWPHLLDDMHILVDERDEGHCAGTTRSVTSTICLNTQPEAASGELSGPFHHNHESSSDQVRSPSPELRESSVVSVPPSESESEFEEAGYTSSSTDSSSPSGWEIIDSDDDLTSSPYSR